MLLFFAGSFAMIALAHAFIGGIAGIGHGRGGYLNAFQGTDALLGPEMAAGFHAAMDALVFLFIHDGSAPF